jgi:aromatic-L-amino-acid decarboxylase
MTTDEFRRHGHAVIDWIADYWDRIEQFPVLSQAAPGEIAQSLPSRAPHSGEDFAAVLEDLNRVVLPGITHWQHPGFFAYFPANSSPAAVLGDLISSGIGAQGMIWATSPAVTEIEQVVLDWMATELGLPDEFRNASGTGGGVIQDTASTATMTAMVAALHRATGGAARLAGLQDGRRYAVYTSSQAHSSVLKAAMMTGIGSDAVREIAVEPSTQSMLAGDLERAIAADVDAGVIPVMAVAAVGTTSTCAIDPTAEIGRICQKYGVWMHIDAAFAGVAAICPEYRYVIDGVELADSFVTNAHKWMLTTFDCSLFWVRDRGALIGALSILPEYLRNAATESGDVVDYRDWHPQLGRRFRSIKLWAVLRTYGVEGVRAHIRSGVELARQFEDWVRADDRFEVLVPRELSVVVFALGDDAATMQLMERVNASGTAYLTHTKVNGRAALRMAIGSVWTREQHVRAAWELIAATADHL